MENANKTSLNHILAVRPFVLPILFKYRCRNTVNGLYIFSFFHKPLGKLVSLIRNIQWYRPQMVNNRWLCSSSLRCEIFC
jgi:hypothetical protein